MHQPRVHVQSKPRPVHLANGLQHQEVWKNKFWYFQQMKENLTALQGFNCDLGSYPLSSQTLVFSLLIQGCSSPPSLGFPTEQGTSPQVLSVSAQQGCAEGNVPMVPFCCSLQLRMKSKRSTPLLSCSRTVAVGWWLWFRPRCHFSKPLWCGLPAETQQKVAWYHNHISWRKKRVSVVAIIWHDVGTCTRLSCINIWGLITPLVCPLIKGMLQALLMWSRSVLLRLSAEKEFHP